MNASPHFGEAQMRPERSQDTPPPDPIETRVTVGERIDPAAADALWRILFCADHQPATKSDDDRRHLQ